MSTARRARSDSSYAAVQAFRAPKSLEWPSLEVTRLPAEADDKRAQAIFDRIATSRAPGDWRQHDPVLIAQLAIVQVQLDSTMQILATEGWTTLGGKTGMTPIRSPHVDIAQHLSTRALALSRALGITGDPIDSRTVRKNARAIADACAITADVEGEDDRSLLA